LPALAALLCVLGSTLLDMALPWIFRQSVDVVFVGRKAGALPYLAIGLVTIGVGSGILTFGRRYLTAFIAQGAVYDLRNHVYEFLLDEIAGIQGAAILFIQVTANGDDIDLSLHRKVQYPPQGTSELLSAQTTNPRSHP